MIYTGWACPGRTRELLARAREPGPDPYIYMHIGCTRDCQNGLASTILNSTSQPCRPCQLQDACAQHTTNGVRVEYASGTVDRTYLELVALYRAGYPRCFVCQDMCAATVCPVRPQTPRAQAGTECTRSKLLQHCESKRTHREHIVALRTKVAPAITVAHFVSGSHSSMSAL